MKLKLSSKILFFILNVFYIYWAYLYMLIKNIQLHGFLYELEIFYELNTLILSLVFWVSIWKMIAIKFYINYPFLFKGKGHITRLERSKGRSKNFYSMTPEDQWAEDKRLGLLDWDGR